MADLLRRSGLQGIGTWLKKKVVEPSVEILSRGAEPKQLAFSTALGVTLGVFPIVGVTFFLCLLAIAVLGTSVNAPAVMLANFVATPVELSLMVVFLRFGEYLTGGAHFPLTSDALKKVLTGKGSKEILLSVVRAFRVGSVKPDLLTDLHGYEMLKGRDNGCWGGWLWPPLSRVCYTLYLYRVSRCWCASLVRPCQSPKKDDAPSYTEVLMLKVRDA
ncbi:hypothetical protein OSB04_002825 [Centaurea solstitialis]|uniref:DUF2062 domain-containing protein n=1 Tax=Centaurea solstitialis TaxID=347529 RepID=A0AA38TVH1_9ASTR|nr:hypothetical protein OSB04_002825 [Centaurea solstitialis]